MRYVALYNHQLPQSALGSKTPIQVMKECYRKLPDLFHKQSYGRPGYNVSPFYKPFLLSAFSSAMQSEIFLNMYSRINWAVDKSDASAVRVIDERSFKSVDLLSLLQYFTRVRFFLNS